MDHENLTLTIPPVPMPTPPGPELLKAQVAGDGLPQMRRRAMQYARDLYGQEAELRVESCSVIRTRVRMLTAKAISVPSSRSGA